MERGVGGVAIGNNEAFIGSQEADLTKLSPEDKMIAEPLANIFGHPMIKRLFSNNWTMRAQAIAGLDKELASFD